MNPDYREAFALDEEVTYLNCANMAPLLKAAKEAAIEGLERRAAPWKMGVPEWFDNTEILRGSVAKVFGVSHHDIALIPSASYGLAVAGKNLSIPKDKDILVLADQYPSNYYVWHSLALRQGLNIVTVKRQEGKSLTECVLNTINKNTGLVAIPNCHWIDGALVDLLQVSKAAKSVGAFLVLDLSQSLGALPFSIQDVDPDFVISVGYKWLLGPYGMGYLYAAPRFHDNGDPLEYSWFPRKGSEDFTKLTQYTPEFKPGAQRFDVGETAQFHLVPIATAGVNQLLKWGVQTVQQHSKALTDRIANYLQSRNLLEFQLPRAGHIIGVPLDKLDASKVKEQLTKRKISESFRGTSIRVSPHLYNTEQEVDSFLECLDAGVV